MSKAGLSPKADPSPGESWPVYIHFPERMVWESKINAVNWASQPPDPRSMKVLWSELVPRKWPRDEAALDYCLQRGLKLIITTGNYTQKDLQNEVADGVKNAF